MIFIHYAEIKNLDIANGPDFRVSLFVSGCKRACKGCFNKEAWNFNYGKKFSWETVHELERLLRNPNIKGLSILGGDPFECENREWVEVLCAYVKHNMPDKDIWVWTGYLWENICDNSILNYVDVLVDGPFVDNLRDLTLKYKGSQNQRVIDVSASKRTNKIVLYDD